VSQSPQKVSGSRIYEDGWRAINELIRSDGSWSGRERDVCYRNLGGGRFEDVSKLVDSALEERKSSRGAAFGDFDNDGDVDAAVMNMGEAPSLYRNDLGGSNHWVQFRLQGTKSNHAAIGATATLHSGAAIQARAVLSQSSFVSHSDLRLHFGLGDAKKFDKVTVRWPSGSEEEFAGGGADRRYLLIEGSGVIEPLEAGE